MAPPRRSMPGLPVPGGRRTRPLAGAAIALGLLVALGWAGSAVAQTPTRARQATLTAEVPAGQFRGLRLRNVPRNARIAIAARATRRITVSLLNADDASRFPAPGEPLFAAPVESALSFAVVIPAAGDYVLMLDNTRGETPSKVVLLVRAARGDAASPQAPSAAPEGPGVPPPDRPPLRNPPAPMHEM